MKKNPTLQLIKSSLFLSLFLISAGQAAFGQDCNALFMHKVGSEAELTLYSATHMVMGKNVTTVTEVKDEDKVHVIKTTNTHYTAAGVANSVSNLTYVCNDTVTRLFYDNKAIAEKTAHDLEEVATKKGGKGFVYATSSDPIEFPLELKTGMTLKPYESLSSMSYTVTEKQWKEVGLPKFSDVNNSAGYYDHTNISRTFVEQLVNNGVGTGTRMVTTNIQVGAMEPVTVPGGTFNCFKITAEMYSMTVAKKETGRWLIGTVSRKFSSPKQDIVQWFCPGVGTVKQEIHGADGKIVLTTELTKLTN